MSDRASRRVVSGLRATARRTGDRARPRHCEVLLCDRVALVGADLLETAALLETARDPDPACVADLHKLLTDGCASPLYNRDLHLSELRAALFYARRHLA